MQIDNLIEKYPKIFQDYEGNPGRVNWSVPKGWIQIVDDLCGSLQSYIDNVRYYSKEHGEYTPPQVQCLQVKEKFGGLRFYTINHNDIQEGMIMFAEYLSKNTCIKCGSRDGVEMKTEGWIQPLCKNCNQNVNVRV